MKFNSRWTLLRKGEFWGVETFHFLHVDEPNEIMFTRGKSGILMHASRNPNRTKRFKRDVEILKKQLELRYEKIEN